jgi:hypothetical protein
VEGVLMSLLLGELIVIGAWMDPWRTFVSGVASQLVEGSELFLVCGTLWCVTLLQGCV